MTSGQAIAGSDPSVSCGRFLPRPVNSTARRLLVDSIIERVSRSTRKGPAATRGFALWLTARIDSRDDEAVRNTSDLCHESAERRFTQRIKMKNCRCFEPLSNLLKKGKIGGQILRDRCKGKNFDL